MSLLDSPNYYMVPGNVLRHKLRSFAPFSSSMRKYNHSRWNIAYLMI